MSESSNKTTVKEKRETKTRGETKRRVRMSALDLVVRNGVYTTKGGNDDRRSLSNCTMKLTKLVKAGERSGYIGKATHKNGACK